MSFPSELQYRFEQAIIKHRYARGERFVLRQFAEHFEADPQEMSQVVAAAYRKGLLAQHPEGEFEILGLPTPELPSLFTHTAQAGLKPTSKVRRVEIEAATPEVAQKLDLADGHPVYRFERTRLVNSIALSNQINYIPLEICPGLEEDDVSQRSFQKLLEAKYNTITAEVQESFSTHQATAQDCEILSLPQGSMILLVERLALSATHRPLVWARLHINPDHYQYVAALWPSAAKLLKE